MSTAPLDDAYGPAAAADAGRGAGAPARRGRSRWPRPRRVSTFDALGRVLAEDVRSRSTCRRPTTARWTATRCAAPTCRPPARVLPVSQRIPAGAVGAPLRAGHRGAHLHRRAGAGRRRCGGDAGAVRAPDGGGVRIDAVPAAGPVDPPPRRGRARRRRRAAAPARASRRRRSAWPPRSARRTLPVARRPRVALFSTGDELVMPGEPLQARRDLQLQPLHAARRCSQALGCEVHRPRHRARPARRHARRAARGGARATT